MNRRRFHLSRVAATAAVVLTLGAVTASDAAGGVSIRFDGGYAAQPPGHHARHGRGPRYSHGVPFIKRRGPGYRGHHRHHRRHHLHERGPRGRHILGSGCSPAIQRYRDRHGHLIIYRVTVCHDRYGRPYVLGGPRGRH